MKERGMPCWSRLRYWLMVQYIDAASVKAPELDRVHDEYKSRAQWLEKLWTMFSLVNALLISSSVQPFAQTKVEGCTETPMYSIVWTITLALNCLALSASIIASGYVIVVPSLMVEEFIQLVGSFVVLPLALTLFGTARFVVATLATTWCAYGLTTFIVAIIVVVIGLVLVFSALHVTNKAVWATVSEYKSGKGAEIVDHYKAATAAACAANKAAVKADAEARQAASGASEVVGCWRTSGATGLPTTNMEIAFSKHINYKDAMRDSRKLDFPQHDFSKYICLGGSRNTSGSWTASLLSCTRDGIERNDFDGYVGIVFSIEREDAKLARRFCACFAAAKAQGLKVAVTISVSPPSQNKQFDDVKFTLICSLLEDPNIDYFISRLPSGIDMSSLLSHDGVPWRQYFSTPARLIPSVLDEGQYQQFLQHCKVANTAGYILNGAAWNDDPNPHSAIVMSHQPVAPRTPSGSGSPPPSLPSAGSASFSSAQSHPSAPLSTPQP